VANSPAPNERREILYSGRVQGVGFRYTTQRIAGGFDVAGFVRNLPDGRVQLVCEGSKAELKAFLTEIQNRLGHYVTSTADSREPASGGFTDFSIRF
jgi:acylphosphatase